MYLIYSILISCLLTDCNDLILTDKEVEQEGIFTILLSNSFQITPKLPSKCHHIFYITYCYILLLTCYVAAS